MALRHITYGYKIEKGLPVIVPEEAEVVRQIFNRYNNGESLLSISNVLTEQQVYYFEDKHQWNKNMVARILENGKYIGEQAYPSIVSQYVFETANKSKSERGRQKIEGTAEVEYLRGFLFCACCGRKMTRRGMWKTRERWVCPCGCKKDIYLSDRVVTDGIVQAFMKIRKNPALLDCPHNIKDDHHVSVDVIRQENEVARLFEETGTSFGVMKKATLKMAQMRFSCCVENPAEAYTELLKEEFTAFDGHLSVDFMKMTCRGFRANQDGTITAILKNGAEIQS